MKSAKLHNGVVIKFPEDTPDSEIDAVVKSYLGIDDDDKKDSQAIAGLKGITTALASVAKSIDAVMKGMSAETDKILASQAALIKATQENKQIADAVAKGATEVLIGQKKLAQVATDITNNLQRLTEEEHRANVLRAAPRVLILNDDGEPVGITVQV